MTTARSLQRKSVQEGLEALLKLQDDEKRQGVLAAIQEVGNGQALTEGGQGFVRLWVEEGLIAAG